MNLKLKEAFAQTRKAVAAGLGAALAAYLVAISDGTLSQADEQLVVGALVVGVLTFFLPNAIKPAAPAATPAPPVA